MSKKQEARRHAAAERQEKQARRVIFGIIVGLAVIALLAVGYYAMAL